MILKEMYKDFKSFLFHSYKIDQRGCAGHTVKLGCVSEVTPCLLGPLRQGVQLHSLRKAPPLCHHLCPVVMVMAEIVSACTYIQEEISMGGICPTAVNR